MVIMKLGTVPTSPQHRSVLIPTNTHSRLAHLVLVLISSIVGGAAGWFSAILVQLYPQWLPAEGSEKVVFVKNDQDNSTTQIAGVVSMKSAATVVTIYAGDTVDFNTAAPLGCGALLSADGWIITASKAVEQNTHLAVLLNDGRVFVTNRIVFDSYNNTSYLKISGNDLPAVNFATDPIPVGQLEVWYMPGITTNPTIVFGHVINVATSSSAVFSTQHNNVVMLTDRQVDSNSLGGPVFNQVGDMIGLNLLDQKILPVDSITSGMYQIFAEGNIKHSTIDVDYIPLYWTVNSDTTKQIGVMVTAVHSKNTPLQMNDVIIAVNDTSLDERTDLSTLLNTLTTPTVQLTLQRSGATMTIPLTLQ